jgi:Cu/Ag efflux pump CusA
VVELTFADAIDNYLARQLVLERVQARSFPRASRRRSAPCRAGVSEFYATWSWAPAGRE